MRYALGAFLAFAPALYPASVDFKVDNFASLYGLTAIEKAVYEATNRARESEDLPPVTWDELLARAALQHSDEMKRLFYFSHDSPTSGLKDARNRIYAAGATETNVSENLVSENSVDANGTSAEEIGDTLVELLLASEKHRENIMDRRANSVGVGCVVTAEGTLFCTQVFSKKTLKFKTLKLNKKKDKVLDVTLTLKFNDEVGVWVDEEDVHVFQPQDGKVTVRLLFTLSKGVRKIAMARRIPGTFGPMTSFFIGKFDPKRPYKFSAAITEIDILAEEQVVAEMEMMELEAKGRKVANITKLKISDADSRYGVQTRGNDFKAKIELPVNSGVHKVFFVTDDEATHGVTVDTDAPLADAFRQGW